MSQGVIILLIIALFFGLMYLYAYQTGNAEERRARKKYEKRKKSEELRKAEFERNRQERLKKIDEKFESDKKRSDEIKKEIARLNALKQK